MRLRLGSRDFRISTSHEQPQWYVDSTARVISSRVLVRMCIHNVSAVLATSGAGDDDTRLRLLATASRDMTVRLWEVATGREFPAKLFMDLWNREVSCGDALSVVA
jgi:hypothetical protein